MGVVTNLAFQYPLGAASVVAVLALVVVKAVWPLLPSRSRPPTIGAVGPEFEREVVGRTAEERRVLASLAPSVTAVQKRAALAYLRALPRKRELRGRQSFGDVPAVCVVTGGTGFVGQRLVEMLVERGARKVISLDIVPQPEGAWQHPAIEYRVGDITDAAAVEAAVKGADCVWHNAAAVGPFHPLELYDKVNYQGTVNVVKACRKHGVRKIVMSSSPSTRFDGSDIDGLTEDQMPKLPQKRYLQAYASSKARGELYLTQACSDSLMTVAVAPHQVYGPRDNLFVPNVMEAAGTGMLRVFVSPRTGYGRNRVCFTHVDNYAHGLILAASALYPGSPALGKFYIVTDGDTHLNPAGFVEFWDVVDRMIVHLGFPSIWTKTKLPDWLLYPAAYACNLIGFLLRIRLKLNPFNVAVLTMHRWFRIDAAVRDLGFFPIVPFKDGWADAAEWTRQHWLPKFRATHNQGLTGISTQSQRKIDIQSKSALGELPRTR